MEDNCFNLNRYLFPFNMLREFVKLTPQEYFSKLKRKIWSHRIEGSLNGLGQSGDEVMVHDQSSVKSPIHK